MNHPFINNYNGPPGYNNYDDQTGYDNQQADYSDKQSGYDNSPSGYSNAQSGYDTSPPSYSTSPSNYPSAPSAPTSLTSPYAPLPTTYDEPPVRFVAPPARRNNPPPPRRPTYFGDSDRRAVEGQPERELILAEIADYEAQIREFARGREAKTQQGLRRMMAMMDARRALTGRLKATYK